MKFAITATGTGLDADIDPRFGRCKYIVFIDPDTMEYEALENTAAGGGGAGIATGQFVVSQGVTAVLTGDCGPNAYQVLSAANIRIITGVSGKVREAVEAFKTGRLKAVSQPTVQTHHGLAK